MEAEIADPALLPVVTSDSSDRYDALRSAGKWVKLLGGTGCFIWVHSLTHESVAMRPHDYEDEAAAEVVEVDVASGLYKCEMTELVDELNRTIDDEKMTPLLVDNSDDGRVAAFFSYNGIVCDISGLGLPLQQQRKAKIKPKTEMEKLRQASVNAIKAGSTLAVCLGNIDNAVSFESLCKRDTFPIEMFQEAGKKILTPSFPTPRCAKMYKEEDKEGGVVTFRDKFRMVLITTLSPSEVESGLKGCIPMEYVKPIYVLFGS